MTAGAPSCVAKLAERIPFGDRSAEDEFVASFYEKAFLMALGRTRDREAALELAQETILAAHCGLRDGRLQDPDRLAGYVCGTARNLVRDYLRSRQPRTSPIGPDAPAAPDPEQEAEQPELHFLVRRVLRALRDSDRDVLPLSFVDGLGPAKIAERLGVRPDAICQRKTRALQRARELLPEVSRTLPESQDIPRGTQWTARS